MTQPDKLTVAEVQEIAIKSSGAKNVPAWKDLAENIEILAKQLLDTMRENERLLIENEKLKKLYRYDMGIDHPNNGALHG